MTTEDRVFDGQWRLLSDDPVLKQRKWFLYDNEGNMVIKTETYVEDMVADNTAMLNESIGQRFGEGRIVARVPLDVYYAKLAEAQAGGDDRYVKKWLDDSDNRAWRTFRGRL